MKGTYALSAFVFVFTFVIAAGCSNDKKGTTTPAADPPVLQSITPDTVVAGTTALVRGEKLGEAQGSGEILFGGRSAQSLSWTATRILAIVPEDVTPGNLIVTVQGRASNLIPYRTANKAPRIERVEPAETRIGETVRLEGRLFGVSRRDSKVFFGSLEATTLSWADSVLEAVVPEGAVSGNLQVLARGLGSNLVPFTLPTSDDPFITSVEPDSAGPGSGVLIHGRNFTNQGTGGQVLIGGAVAALSVWSDTLIDGSVGWQAAAGPSFVRVMIGGRSSNDFPFTVLAPVVITRLEPARTTIGDIITIYGTGFQTASVPPEVTFEGPQATRIQGGITVWDEGSIRVRVPQGAIDGPVTVRFGDQVSEGSFFSVAPRRMTFTADVHPLFQAKGCLDCHSGAIHSGNLVLETKATVLTSRSDHYPVVQVRNSAESIIVRKVGPHPPFGDRMPQGCTTNCLSDEEILTLADWIDQGTDN